MFVQAREMTDNTKDTSLLCKMSIFTVNYIISVFYSTGPVISGEEKLQLNMRFLKQKVKLNLGVTYV